MKLTMYTLISLSLATIVEGQQNRFHNFADWARMFVTRSLVKEAPPTFVVTLK